MRFVEVGQKKQLALAIRQEYSVFDDLHRDMARLASDGFLFTNDSPSKVPAYLHFGKGRALRTVYTVEPDNISVDHLTRFLTFVKGL